MILQKFHWKSQRKKLLSLTVVFTLLLSLFPAVALPVSGSTITYQFTVYGGKHGQVRYDGSTADSKTFSVLEGDALPDGIEIIPDAGYVLDSFTFSAKIQQIEAGMNHTVVLTEDGKVYAAGDNQYGQLGMGNNDNCTVFTQVASLSDKTVTAISAGDDFTIALTSDGKLYVTGRNDMGQLGLGDMTNRNIFTQVASLSDETITTIAAGEMYAFAASSDGKLYSTGYNCEGQLGLGDTKLYNSFTEVTSLSGKTVTSIVAGSLHTFVLTTEGLYAAGYNDRGQLGLGNTNVQYSSFTEVTSLSGKTVVAAAAGAYHSAVVTSDGHLYAAGWNRYGQTGLGLPYTDTCTEDFTEVPFPGGKTVVSIKAGDYNTVALTSDGMAYISGWPLNNSNLTSTYTEVSSLSGKIVNEIGIGFNHSLAATSDGGVYAIGDNSYGQSGLENVTEESSFTLLTNTPWVNAASSLSEIGVNFDTIATASYKKFTSLALTASPVNASYPQNIVLTGVLSGADILSGKTVDFYDGSKLLGSEATDANGKAVYTVTVPDAGIYSFKAVFAGDSANASSQSDTVSCTVDTADQAPLILSNVPSLKTYGDDPFTVSLSGGTGSGEVTFLSSNPSVATVDNSGNVTIVGTGKFTITAKKAASSNYKETSLTSAEITVLQKSLTVTGLSAVNRDYDGSTDVVLTGGALSTIVSGDQVLAVMPTKGTITDKKAGNGKTVTIPAITLTGSDKDNYVLTQPSGITVNISPKTVAVNGVSVKDKTYDGTKTAEILSSGTLSGVLTGDTVTITSGICTFISANAGDSIGVISSGFTLDGGDKENYSLSIQPEAANAKINKANLTVSVPKITVKTGQAIPALTTQVTGFVNGETESSVSGFQKPTAEVNGSYDTTNTALTNFNVSYNGGNATNNYKFSYVNTVEIEVQSVPVTDGDYSSDKSLSNWQNGSIIITPQNGYTQISTDKLNWQAELTLSKEGENSVTFYLKKTDGTLTESKTLSYKIDKTAPEAEIMIKENSFKSFISTITFGLFCKNNVDVSINGTDTLSGIAKIEYQKAASLEDYDPNGTWTEENAFSTNKNEVFVVFARVTDSTGNVTVVNSENIIVYKDSGAETTEIIYEKLSGEDKDVQVNLNSNTIKNVLVNGTTLGSTQFSVSGGVITIKADYLETLAAGDYTANVLYNPMGKEFIQGTDKGDEPIDTSFTIKIVRKSLTVSDLDYKGPSNLVYDGSAKTASVEPKTGVAGIGTITIKYYKGASQVSEAKDAGTYTVKVNVTSGVNYAVISNLVIGTFTIVNAAQNIPNTLSAINPTTPANNDGKIMGVNSSMEYKKSGETNWTAVSGTQITGLSDGTYLVRYAAKPNYNESEAAEVVIAAGESEFTERNIENNDGKVTVTGQLTKDAALNIIPITGGNANYDSLIKLVDASKNNVIGAFEVTITGGEYNGKLNLVFNVGREYDGKTLTIYHKKRSGQVEQFTVVCREGKAALTVDELSPFLIIVPASAMPQTGSMIDFSFLLGLGMLIILLGMIWYKKAGKKIEK